MQLNTLFIELNTDLNKINGIISRILTIYPTLFAAIKELLVNKNVNIFVIKREIVTNLHFLSFLPLLSLFLLCFLD